MHVTKVVDLVTRIPEQLSLNFYDFLRIYIDFTILLFLKQKKNKTYSRIYALEGFGELQIGPCRN